MFESIVSTLEAAIPAPATAAPEPSKFATIPSHYTGQLSGISLPNAGYIPEPTAEQITASKDERIAELEAALAAHAKQTHGSPVILPNGEELPVKAAEKELAEMSVWAQVEILKSQRFVRELAEQQALLTPQPVSLSTPLLDPDSAEKLMGYDAWKKAPNSVKAAALDIRKADVDRMKVEDHFGPNTSRAAHELSKSNPAMYELLREKAVQKGIIAARGTAPGPGSTMRGFGV